MMWGIAKHFFVFLTKRDWQNRQSLVCYTKNPTQKTRRIGNS